MGLYLLILLIVVGFPALGFAQFLDKGDYVQVAIRTKLCSNAILEQSKGVLDPGQVFWRVTSHVRVNGTQSVNRECYLGSQDRDWSYGQPDHTAGLANEKG